MLQLNNISTTEISREYVTINILNTRNLEYKIEHLLNALSIEEKKQSDTFPLESTRQKFIIHRALLRLQLASYLQQEPDQIVFELGKFGKPKIHKKINNLNIKFNISHSDNFAVFGFNTNFELGIDIEEERSFSSLFPMASLVCASSEITELKSLPLAEQNQQFLYLWTKKEAISKALGLGLNMNFKELVLGYKKSSQENFCQTHNLELVDISQAPLFYATVVSLLST